jgi:hypothetical protein
MLHHVRILLGFETAERVAELLSDSACSGEAIQLKSIIKARYTPRTLPSSSTTVDDDDLSPLDSIPSPAPSLPSLPPSRFLAEKFRAVAATAVFTRRTLCAPQELPDDPALPEACEFSKVHNAQLRAVIRRLATFVTVKYEHLVCRKFLAELEAVYPRRNTREAGVLAKMKDRVRSVVARWRQHARLKRKDVREVLEYAIALQDTR